MRIYTLLAGTLLLSSSAAFGSLVYVGQVDLGGTGIGAVPTILTQQDNRSPRDTTSGYSSGCVGYNGSSDVIGSDACVAGGGVVGGEEKTGASQTLTRSFSDPKLVALNVTSPANLGIIFNSSNQGNNETVTLSKLIATFYSGADLIFAAPLPQPMMLTGFSGTGNSGFMFALDDAQLTALNFIITTNNLDVSSLRIGLNADVYNDEAGNETFFVGYYNRSGDPPQVPEPATAGLAGVALLGAGVFARRFRKA